MTTSPETGPRWPGVRHLSLVRLPDWDDDMPEAEQEKIAYEDLLVWMDERSAWR